MNDLHNLSLKILENINKCENTESLLCKKIIFVSENFIKYEFDYINSSIIFLNCKTFSLDLMNEIAKKLEPMPSGVVLITSFQIIPDEKNWEVFAKLRRLMSWGCANLYLHKRI